MTLRNDLKGYIVSSVIGLGVISYFAHRSLLEETRKQAFEEGQQSMIRYARKNLEAVLGIDCQTRNDELYNPSLFQSYYADINDRNSLAGLEIEIYCEGPDRPMYPQIPPGYSPRTVQVRIPESAFEVRWEEQQFHTTWAHTQGLNELRDKHKENKTSQ